MLELGFIALVNNANTSLASSALPNSPVVPERPPGRLRLFTADALHRLATRLDRGQVPPLGYGRLAER